MKTAPFKLDLSLRRDRGYIYFPDAIQRCLEVSGESPWSWVRAECYKKSAREIQAEPWTGETFNRRDTNLFGSLVIGRAGCQETWLLQERPASILTFYDLEQPILATNFTGQTLAVTSNRSLFPTDFHRFAYLCKVLFHHLDDNSGRRMLLQRIQLEHPPLTGTQEEISVCRELITKDYSMMFSLWRNGFRIGTLVAAARKPVDE